jgi:protein gp37
VGDTDIGWTHRPGTRGRSWNPTQGCALKSEGCRNCYAMRMAARFAESGRSKGLINLKTGKWNGVGRLAAHKLSDPLRWRDPSTVFVNSMSDLFYEAFSNEEIAAVFGVMAATPQHTYQILTKRPDRMRAWFEWVDGNAGCVMGRLGLVLGEAAKALPEVPRATRGNPNGPDGTTWPLPNVWLGVSVENQDAADERIPELLRAPAVVRFLSCEPLLGSLDLLHMPRAGSYHDYLTGEMMTAFEKRTTANINWVIAGCESGPGSRACSVEWLRSLRDQCAAARVPFFLKQAMQKGSEAVGGPLITIGKRSEAGAGGVIQLPYLDGQVHAEFPA